MTEVILVVENLKEKNLEKWKTSELMDKIEETYALQDALTDEQYEFIENLRDELEGREPFAGYIERYNELAKKCEGMQKAIDKLKSHRHLQDGTIVIAL